MKFHKNKKRGIIFFSLTGLAASILFPLMEIGKYESTRNELRSFYEVQFENCKIIKTVDQKYPGRGYYRLFKVDCKSGFYPILSKKKDVKTKGLFKEEARIIKNSNDYNFKLTYGTSSYDLTMRSVEDENDDWQVPLEMALAWTFIMVVLHLIIPNRLFDRASKI